jgi:hypothetical protein
MRSGFSDGVSNFVIPGRCNASNYDVQLHIGESRNSGSGAYAPSRNDDRLIHARHRILAA